MEYVIIFNVLGGFCKCFAFLENARFIISKSDFKSLLNDKSNSETRDELEVAGQMLDNKKLELTRLVVDRRRSEMFKRDEIPTLILLFCTAACFIINLLVLLILGRRSSCWRNCCCARTEKTTFLILSFAFIYKATLVRVK